MYIPFVSPIIHVNMQMMDERTDRQNYSLDFDKIWNSRSTLQDFGAIIFDWYRSNINKTLYTYIKCVCNV
jgi:hypothetical protein